MLCDSGAIDRLRQIILILGEQGLNNCDAGGEWGRGRGRGGRRVKIV